MPAVVGAASTSAGSTTAAAPRGSLTAARKAPMVASATLSGSLISPVNLVTVLSSAAASIDWWVRLSRSSRRTAPHSATTGSCSVLAVSRPVARLVVPGPDVTSTTPGVPVRRPIAARHERRVLLVAAHHQLRAAVDQRVVDGVDLGAGHPEDVLDALRRQHVDDLLRAAHRCTGLRGLHVAQSGRWRGIRAGAYVRSTASGPRMATVCSMERRLVARRRRRGVALPRGPSRSATRAARCRR